MYVSVQNGTGAGRRTVKTPDSWVCSCRKQPGDRYSCPDCGARRP